MRCLISSRVQTLPSDLAQKESSSRGTSSSRLSAEVVAEPVSRVAGEDLRGLPLRQHIHDAHKCATFLSIWIRIVSCSLCIQFLAESIKRLWVRPKLLSRVRIWFRVRIRAGIRVKVREG